MPLKELTILWFFSFCVVNFRLLILTSPRWLFLIKLTPESLLNAKMSVSSEYSSRRLWLVGAYKNILHSLPIVLRLMYMDIKNCQINTATPPSTPIGIPLISLGAIWKDSCQEIGKKVHLGLCLGLYTQTLCISSLWSSHVFLRYLHHHHHHLPITICRSELDNMKEYILLPPWLVQGWA